MGNSLIVLKDGSDVQGKIVDRTFSIQTSAMGTMSNATADIEEINIDLFGGDCPDQMMLTNQTEYRGRLLNATLTLKLSPGNQIKSIPTPTIKTVMVHDDIDS
jgi:hypothetical protein